MECGASENLIINMSLVFRTFLLRESEPVDSFSVIFVFPKIHTDLFILRGRFKGLISRLWDEYFL